MINAAAYAPVAQLDRASDFESEGWGFKSLQARHFLLFASLVVIIFSCHALASGRKTNFLYLLQAESSL